MWKFLRQWLPFKFTGKRNRLDPEYSFVHRGNRGAPAVVAAVDFHPEGGGAATSEQVIFPVPEDLAKRQFHPPKEKGKTELSSS